MLWTATLCLCLCVCSLAGPVPARRGTSERSKLLLVSFDGFRWDYDRDVDTPHLDAMARDGVKATYVTPAFITVTSPTHFTILTGKYIENHGVIHNMWFNSSTWEKKSYYKSQFVNEWWDNGSLPIWITAQRQGLKAGSLHFPGTASTYQGESAVVREVEPENYNYSNETAWRENIDKVMKSWFREQDLDFVSMYFGEPDSTGHKYGPDSPERRAMVRQVDRTVGYLRSMAEQSGLSERLNIIITADHGMSTVYRNGLVDEIVLSKIPGFSFRDLDFHIVDFGPVGLLLPKEGRLDKVYNALKGAHPHLHVYKKEEIPIHLHYSHNDRILPIILWADLGYVINGYFPVQFHKGEHGYDNQALDMKPFFRAVGPDFQKNLEVGPFETVNIYPLMCHLLKITPEPNDGHLNTTQHMLTSYIQTDNESSSDDDILSSVFIGLGSVAGFLLIVFVVVLSRGVHKRRRNKSSSTEEGKIDKCHSETKQTTF
ncbi:Ectonucleotide pyrophosphatase/phosphodiesterase family member 7 [Labeo rohita]|uniref:Ectonucleotide pyrophosphatase/phosphodiesterase family member 7 n=1 Tax=Labeo rohita TaxID=84645 RepID=A0ABQ8MVZ9_LABRO|nr:ectonucleotide pyrophosphatase/phosphodiesterase family member 7 [Labeo rohita]KAI2667008.1 Ectonucleotide pyrophosphatase/phosphodiesterase family member 7 [Labeo rohita]